MESGGPAASPLPGQSAADSRSLRSQSSVGCPLPSVGRAGADENGEKNGPGMGRGSRWSLRRPGVALDLG